MTPIESRHDVRLVTLIDVAIAALETLALELGIDPDRLLAEYLYLSNKKILQTGEEGTLDKLTRLYPLLEEALD